MNKGDVIPDEEILLRRVFARDKKYIDLIGKPTSRAFTPRPKDDGKLSVDIKSLTTYAAAIRDEQRFALFTIHVAFAKSLGLNCIYDPLTLITDGIDNIAHSLVIGIPTEDESISGLLARNSTQQHPY